MREGFVILSAVFFSFLLFGCGPSEHRPIDVYLTVQSEYGEPNPPVGENYLNYGMTITASADSLVMGEPGTRYVCAGWTGIGSAPSTGSTNSFQFTITQNSRVAWMWKTYHYLTIDSLYGSPQGGGWYEEDATAGWSVTSPWPGGTGIRYDARPSSGSVLMDIPKTVTVAWATQYQLRRTILPSGAGRISCSPDTVWYEAAEVVQLTAVANAGYEFTEWSGDLTGSTNPQNLTMDAPKGITASFLVLPVIADFTATPTYGLPPLTVQFTDRSTGVISSWTWDFDNDGTVDSTDGNPSYTYHDAGTFTVRLTVRGPAASDDEVKSGYISVGNWAKSYGGTKEDRASSIQQTSDGGCIVAGYTYSFGAGNKGFWVLKLNDDGTISWQKTYGGTEHDEAKSIQQTGDGGYIVAGSTTSFGAGYEDFWVLKLNSDGTVAWQKTYGGTEDDYAESVQQTSDGGYIVAGGTRSFGASVYDDFWVLKLNSDGTVAWQKRYGGTFAEHAFSVQQTNDGGYIVAGYTRAFSFGSGYDFWVLKLDSDGTVSWQQAYGIGFAEDFPDKAYSIRQTTDGGYVVAGYTDSGGGRYPDFWILKLNSNGAVAWQRRYGSSNYEYAQSIQQTGDGGYIVAGTTGSFSASYYYDFWVLKLNSDGTIPFNSASGAQMTDTSTVPLDTNAGLKNSAVAGVDTSATVIDTSCAVMDTNATVRQQAP